MGGMFRLLHNIQNRFIFSIYLLIIAAIVIFSIMKLIEKVQTTSLRVIIIAATVLVSIGYSYQNTLSGTLFFLNLVFAFAVTSTVLALGLLRLPWYSCCLLFAAALLAGVYATYLWVSFLAVYLFCILVILVRLEKGYVKNQIFTIWMSMAFSVAVYLIYDFLNTIYMKDLVYRIGWEYGLGYAGKLLLWFGILAFYTVITGVFLWLIKKLCKSLLQDIKTLEGRHIKFGSEFLITFFIVLVFIYMFSIAVSAIASSGRMMGDMSTLIYGFDLMLVLIQTVYVVLMVKLAHARVQEAEHRQEKQELLRYNSSLEQNMKQIRGIKHDIKNLFFTMGEYVNRSKDEEMKAFFQEKIAPFAGEEIQKNDLYMKLQDIPEEEFQAFLYYKISQAISYGLHVQLEIDIRQEESGKMQMFTDVVRILGIFLDNGIEESVETEAKLLLLKIHRSALEESYAVANSIRLGVQEKGIVSGTTTKGLGRGNGLLIAQEISEKYPNMISNSYFKDGRFYQSIIIYNH